LLLPLSPLLFAQPSHAGELISSLFYVTNYGIFGAALYFRLRDDPAMRELFLASWPATFIGGLAFACSSNNGPTNFGLGFVPAAIVTTVLITVAADRASGTHRKLPPGALTAGMVPLIVLVALQFTSVYRDDRLDRLDSRVASGPYAGLFTTADTRLFIERMTSDLRRLSPANCRILFYDHFPAGYLMSSSRPYTNAVYLLVVGEPKIKAYRRLLFDYYDAKGVSAMSSCA
jgi:hypothetical protein